MLLWTVFESHLDPFGSLTNFTDAAFHNVFNGGVVIVSATDVASLYGTCPAPALRNYGARIVRTHFFKEMAVRVVISALARFVARFMFILLATWLPFLNKLELS